MRLHLGLSRGWRGVYLSDLHYAPWCGKLLQQVWLLLSELEPDALLFGGDLLDLPFGASGLADWVRRAGQRWPLYAVPGNHDRWCGLSRLKRKLPGLEWLDEGAVELACGLRLCGRSAQGACARSVLVGHEPNRVKGAARAGFPAMLAGHHHACQWITHQAGGKDYPGAWFFAYHGPYFEVGRTRLWVSRGVNDQLPLRLNCPRDVLLLEVS